MPFNQSPSPSPSPSLSLLTNKMADGISVFTVDNALTHMGFGRFQGLALAYAGMGWIAEAMEVMLLSFVGPAVHTKWGLSPRQESMISSFVFVGMMVGACLWGSISDAKGRRYGFFVTAVWTFCVGLSSAFAPNYASLVALRCLVGVGLGGGPVLTSWFLEFIPAHSRGFWMIVFASFWTIGTVFEASLAWIVMPRLGWRWLVGLSSIPLFILLLFYRFVPESPRYLMTKGRFEDARCVIEKVARVNKKSLPVWKLASDEKVKSDLNVDEEPEESIQNTSERINKEAPVDNKFFSKFLMLFSRPLIRTTLLLWWVYFANAFSYYGLVLLTSSLSGGGRKCSQHRDHVASNQSTLYKNVFISTFAEFPGLLIAAAVVDKCGRKPSMAALFFVSSIFTLPLAFPQSKVVTTVLLFGARLFISGTFSIVYIYAPEIYPTSVRTTGFGAASSFSRLGGILCPLIAVGLVESCKRVLAVLLFVFVLLSAAVSVILFPKETKGQDLQDVIESKRDGNNV